MTEHTAATTRRVRELFDAKAATWSLKYAAGGRLAGRLAWLVGAMEERVAPGDRILDLGCGTGDLARQLARDGLRVTACDISAQMLAHAALADPDQTVEWAALDPGWRLLPFPAATFGAVMASSVLEYVDDPAVVLRECARILRPGGIAFCTVPDVRHPVRWLELLAGTAARSSLLGAAAARWPRLDRYLNYLQLSRQRRSVKWWRSASAQAGLQSLPAPVSARGQSPLRLLMLSRPEDSREDQWRRP